LVDRHAEQLARQVVHGDVDSAHRADADALAVPKYARSVHQLPGTVDFQHGLADEQLLEMLDQAGDRMVAVLPVGDLTQSILAVVAGDSHQTHVLVFDHAAAVLVLDRWGKRVS
jgi:hypothetical protein